MSTPNRIPMFATANDTDQYAVCVDGRFGLFTTKEEAVRVYQLASPITGEGYDTHFGSCEFLPPHTRPMMDLGLAAKLGEDPDMTKACISELRSIDIESYIRKNPERFKRNYTPERITAQEHIARIKTMRELTGWDIEVTPRVRLRR